MIGMARSLGKYSPQFSGAANEMRYSCCLIRVVGVFNLTLAGTSLLDSTFDHLLGIDRLLRDSPSQTWIGLVILELLEDARLEIVPSFK